MDIIIDADKIESIDPTIKPREVATSVHFYHHLLNCMGYDPQYPPMAALLNQYHGLAGEWVMVSPVYWQATHNDAMFVVTERDSMWSEANARACFATLASFVAKDGMHLYYHSPDLWLLQGSQLPALNAKPAYCLLQQSLLPHLQALDSSLFWQRLITECQMLFSHHDIVARNGVWFWGQGSLQPPSSRPIYCLQPLLIPLAQCLSTNVTLYQSGQRCDSTSILLGDTASDWQRLTPQQLATTPLYWHWNNAMDTLALPWLTRLRHWIKNK